VAVGSFFDQRWIERPLIERWTGGRWSIDTADPAAARLNEVSCVSALECFAVGSLAVGIPLAESWNGSHWSIQRMPDTSNGAGGALDAVSCNRVRGCMAVGAFGDGTPLAERWSHGRWSVQAVPSVPPSPSLVSGSSLACAQSRFCIVGGGVWDGRKWSSQRFPDPDYFDLPQLAALSCASAAMCIAVGADSPFDDPTALVEQWNGRIWRPQAAPSPPGSSLTAVSCPSPNACTAVGNVQPPSTPGAQANPVPLVERWNGSAWALEQIPTPAGSANAQLDSISCADGNSCTAVGSFTDQAGVAHALIEHLAGSEWLIQSPAVPADPTSQSLDGVSCPTTSFCLATGMQNPLPLGSQTSLVERWSGTQWSIDSAATGAYGESTAVSCPTPTACTVISNYPDQQHTGVDHWNGTTWQPEQLQPTPPGPQLQLDAIACPSVASCVLIGESGYLGEAPIAYFVQHWNGSRWSLIAWSCGPPSDCGPPPRRRRPVIANRRHVPGERF
jgi:hypothetical protein